jgi:rubredoxin
MTHDRPGLSEPDPETGRAEPRCSVCGYGVIASGSPPACPMCQANAWEQLPWRPFAPADRGSASSRNPRVGERPEMSEPPAERLVTVPSVEIRRTSDCSSGAASGSPSSVSQPPSLLELAESEADCPRGRGARARENAMAQEGSPYGATPPEPGAAPPKLGALEVGRTLGGGELCATDRAQLRAAIEAGTSAGAHWPRNSYDRPKNPYSHPAAAGAPFSLLWVPKIGSHLRVRIFLERAELLVAPVLESDVDRLADRGSRDAHVGVDVPKASCSSAASQRASFGSSGHGGAPTMSVMRTGTGRGARYGGTIRQRESPLRPALLSASAKT